MTRIYTYIHSKPLFARGEARTQLHMRRNLATGAYVRATVAASGDAAEYARVAEAVGATVNRLLLPTEGRAEESRERKVSHREHMADRTRFSSG
jgi:hypothetical protein